MSFNIGFTRDFLTDDGRLVFNESALGILNDEPGVHHEFVMDFRKEMSPDQIAEYDAVITYLPNWTRKSLEGLDRLTVIARFGVGYDMVDVEACTENDVILAITPDGVRRPMAEGALALVLAVAKEIFPKSQVLREGRWMEHKFIYGSSLTGKTLGTIGLGSIGADLMRLLEPFELERRLAHDPFCPAERAQELSVELVELDTLLSESDFVCINCMLNDETRGLIGERELGLMKDTAYLINTARGPIVNQRAITEALLTKRIRGAALDVFEVEPLPVDDPLLELDNVILLPHAIGWTEEALRDNARLDCEAALSVYRGEAPTHVVNREVLERPGLQAKLARYKERQG